MDIVKQLRQNASSGDNCRGDSEDMTEAADEITRLRSIVEPLESLLGDMVSIEIMRCDADDMPFLAVVTEMNHIEAIIRREADTLPEALAAAMAERNKTDG